MPPKINLEGRRFHRLLVIEEHPVRTKSKEIQWLCRCNCGKLTVVKGTNLTRGYTWSCGCLGGHSHGLSDAKLYRVWAGMKQRCCNLNSADYSNYGGRGIKVCIEWEKDFKVFYDFAIAKGWQAGLTIDRIDNDGDYCPKNVRFVSWEVQNRNRRKMRRAC